MSYFQSIEDHTRLGHRLKEISEIADILSKSPCQKRPGLPAVAQRAHDALTKLRHELEELALRQYPDTDISKLRALYFPGSCPRDHKGDPKI